MAIKNDALKAKASKLDRSCMHQGIELFKRNTSHAMLVMNVVEILVSCFWTHILNTLMKPILVGTYTWPCVMLVGPIYWSPSHLIWLTPALNFGPLFFKIKKKKNCEDADTNQSYSHNNSWHSSQLPYYLFIFQFA